MSVVIDHCRKCNFYQDKNKSIEENPCIEEADQLLVARSTGEALSGRTYECINRDFSCKAIRDDHFVQNGNCQLEMRLEPHARSLLTSCKNSGQQIKFRGTISTLKTNQIFLSVFNKDTNRRLGESDLTGDGGQCVWSFVKPISSSFQSVVDIGGQDIDFVKRFVGDVKRVVVDLNILTPFLQTEDCEVDYVIGDAKHVLDPAFFGKLRPPALFAMSNFLNVLSPDYGWEILFKIKEFMRPGDHLVVTNLRKAQFSRKVKYVQGTSKNGLVAFHTQLDGKFYKTTIARKDFIHAFTDGKNAEWEVIRENGKTFRKFELVCSLPNRNPPQNVQKPSIQFITIIFKRSVPKIDP